MNLTSVNYLITAKHYGGSAREYIRNQQMAIQKSRGVAVIINDLDADAIGLPVKARIEQGQWIADCECGGASFVDSDEPIFYCFSCGNRLNDHKPRPVIFPDALMRVEIERLILERPVDDRAGLDDRERAGLAKAVVIHETFGGLARNWNPGETVKDLQEQNKLVAAWRKKIKAGV